MGICGPGIYGPGIYGSGTGIYGPGNYGPGIYGPGTKVSRYLGIYLENSIRTYLAMTKAVAKLLIAFPVLFVSNVMFDDS